MEKFQGSTVTACIRSKKSRCCGQLACFQGSWINKLEVSVGSLGWLGATNAGATAQFRASVDVESQFLPDLKVLADPGIPSLQLLEIDLVALGDLKQCVARADLVSGNFST